MDSARIVAVVVPSPATSDVLEATSRTSCAPIFSYGSSSSISFATVTPSFVIVGLPNFLSRMTLRPLGPSVALTAFASFSMPRSNVCRALSSNCSCFGAAVFRDQHLVALLDREIDFLSIVIDFAGAQSDHFPLLWFFLGGIGDDDPAFFHFLLFDRLHQHPVSERFYVNCCHKLLLLLWFCFVVKPAIVSPCDYQSPANLPLLLFVFVHDLEFRLDDVPFALASAFFSAAARLRFRSRLRTRART